jgi:hypothetical protein
MNVKIWIVIISCIVSIVVTALAYYGFIRYMNICSRDCEHFAKSYLDLDRVRSSSKVVVSFYTRDTDIAGNKTLKSVLNQTVHPDQIIIVSNADIKIPEFLEKKSIATKQVAGSLGSSASFMVPLTTQKDSDTKIIVLTDGVVYGADFIESIVEASEKSPESVIFVESYNARDYVYGRLTDNSPSNVVDLRYGVLLKPKFFETYESTNSSLDAPSAMLSANIIKNKATTRKMKYSEIINARQSKPAANEIKMIEFFAQYFL